MAGRDHEHELEALRDELSQVDRELLEVAARRASLVQRIGACKSRAGRPTRDFARERQVIERARADATELGIDPDLAESLMLSLIRASLTTQERARVAEAGAGAGRSALVIGGAGKMGTWFGRFLAAQGFDVRTADPAGPTDELPWRADWTSVAVDEDVVVVATPLRQTDAVLHGLAEHRPPGLVFDVASLKTPIRSGLQALVQAGVRATSVHPMFGPDAALLSGRHVVFVDLGVPAATAEAQALFEPTMARRVQMGLDEHDRVAATVLGLSHAVNLSFFTALARTGADVPRLASVSSTTFEAQLDVARRVSGENPHLYYDIQHLNAHGLEALDALLAAVTEVRQAVVEADEAGFVALMERGQRALSERR
jgi:chorismate mutase/prephenate dehydrogenase